MTPLSYYRSPLGWIETTQSGGALCSLRLVSKKTARGKRLGKNDPLFRDLKSYFQKKKRHFSMTFQTVGTPFQNRVWKALREVPYGRTVSYADIARRIRKTKAVRAVANAIGQNPAAIFIPCHRVIGSDGSLTGYAYGLRKKSWLLRHESD